MSAEDNDRPDGSKSSPNPDPAAPTEVTEAGGQKPEQTSSVYDDPSYYDESDHIYDDPYAPGHSSQEPAASTANTATSGSSGGSTPPPSTDEDDEEDGMVRMSFLEHLAELRTRILRALLGLFIVYLFCLMFAGDLLSLVLEPFHGAVQSIKDATGPDGIDIKIINTNPLEQFKVMYINVPLVAAVFLGSPWLMFQAWQFIAPGLYKREKHWALPFIFTTSGLFILGGAFCYFIALRFTLQFLLTVTDQVEPYIAVTQYLTTFIILEIGLGLVFQLPVLIFFLTLLRLTTPSFLLRNLRYAVLIMFILAAVITPTGDPITMTIFAGPMILLYFVGIGASWLLVRRREGRKIPWLNLVLTLVVFLGLVAGVVAYLYLQLGYRFTTVFPWFGPA